MGQKWGEFGEVHPRRWDKKGSWWQYKTDMTMEKKMMTKKGHQIFGHKSAPPQRKSWLRLCVHRLPCTSWCILHNLISVRTSTTSYSALKSKVVRGDSGIPLLSLSSAIAQLSICSSLKTTNRCFRYDSLGDDDIGHTGHTHLHDTFTWSYLLTYLQIETFWRVTLKSGSDTNAM